MNDSATPNRFDRGVEDLGNVVELGHVNVTVPDQRLATLFYISGLGLTRDPYLMTGVDNMWANVGRAQFHLPVARAAGGARRDRAGAARHRRRCSPGSPA